MGKYLSEGERRKSGPEPVREVLCEDVVARSLEKSDCRRQNPYRRCWETIATLLPEYERDLASNSIQSITQSIKRQVLLFLILVTKTTVFQASLVISTYSLVYGDGSLNAYH